MLILLAILSMNVCVPQTHRGMHVQVDTLKQENRDTVLEERSATVLKKGMPQEMPGFRTLNSSLSASNGPILHITSKTLDSLLRTHPALRGPLLEELLIPKGQPLEDPMQVALRTFNEQLVKDSRFTPFERMSLIAKRQADLYRWDNSIRWYQLDILGTIRWLQETLK